MAPGLVAFGPAEDRVNALLANETINAATSAVAVQVSVPENRLRDPIDLTSLVASVPRLGVSSYLVWTPGVTEDVLLGDPDLLAGLLQLIKSLAERGVPVGHLHATYATIAMHDVGLAAVVHHLGWLDKGEPAGEVRGGLRSCQTYAPGIRRTIRFQLARDLAYDLESSAYLEKYCDCLFCRGAVAAEQNPLDLLLEYESDSDPRPSRSTDSNKPCCGHEHMAFPRVTASGGGTPQCRARQGSPSTRHRACRHAGGQP